MLEVKRRQVQFRFKAIAMMGKGEAIRREAQMSVDHMGSVLWSMLHKQGCLSSALAGPFSGLSLTVIMISGWSCGSWADNRLGEAPCGTQSLRKCSKALRMLIAQF